MKSFFIIFSVQLRARFGLSALKSDFANNRAKFIKNALLGLLVLFSFATLIGMWGWLVYSLTIGLSQLGMQELSLLLPFMASMLMVLIFGIAGIFGQLFQAKDIELLASLPVGQGAVFASKFFLVYLYELGASLLFVLPAIFAYMLAAGGGAPLIIKGIIAALTVPVIPLAISAFISIILMRFSGFARHRELFMVVAGIALTAAFIGIQQWISFQLGNMSQSEIFAILEQNSGLISLAGRSFSPALWLTNAVALSGMDSLIGWALYLLCSAAVFAAACAVSSRLYMSGALAQLETSKKQGKKARLDRSKLRLSSPMAAHARRELLTMLRSPIYAINALVGIAMFPVMFAVMYFNIASSVTEDSGMSVSVLMEQVPPAIIFCVVFAIYMFVCCVNISAGTSLSREGSYFWLSKTIPVPCRTQVYGKLAFSWATDAATILLCSAVFSFIAINYAPSALVPMLLATLCSLVAAVPSTALCMMADIAHPKLKWTTEAEAMKQNFNATLGMLISVIVGAVFAAAAFAVSFTGYFALSVATALVLPAIAAVVSVLVLGTFADSKYSRLEP